MKSVLATSFGVAAFAWSALGAAQGTFPPAAPAPAPAPAAAPAPATASATVGTGGATATATAPGTDYCNPSTNATPDLGCAGTFVIDQVSGFRGRVGGGVSYYGPLGVAYNTFNAPSGQVVSFSGTAPSISQSETTIRSWSIWLSPSIDYFIVPNLSVGGLFSVDTTFGSAETKITTTSASGPTVKTQQNDLPSVTSFTLIPRLGYLLRVNDRLSFWPRVGLGYFSGSNVSVQPSSDASGTISNVTRETNIRSLIVQIDVALVYQITDNVFFRAAPAITFSSGGSSTVRYKNGASPDSEGSGSAFQFELVSGFGANFSL
ncbi:MAG: hypothetical protein ACXVEE_11950 [Polyangiales bacterium]